jgi:hypothetical protein
MARLQGAVRDKTERSGNRASLSKGTVRGEPGWRSHLLESLKDT